MTSQRRHAVRAIATVAALTTLSVGGCAAQQGATELDTEADVTLQWWTGQSDEAHSVLEGLADDFEEIHPNVTIEVSSGAPSTEELLQKLSAGFASGSYPDISYAFGSWASELESSDMTLDITEQVADPEVGWDEFAEAATATAQPTGEATIGFPAIVDNISLMYNRELFDAAGLEYPDESWTWDDFRDAAAALTDPATETYGYGYSVSGSEETTWQFWPHLWQHGGTIYDEDTLEATFDDDAGVEALTFLQQMAVDDGSVYLDQTDTRFGDLFASGRIGMITSGPWQLYTNVEMGVDYGVAPLPAVDGEHTTVSGADLWVLLDHQDVNREYWAYEFTRWLTDPEQDLQWNVAVGNLPLREEEIETDEFAAVLEQYPGLDVMAENSANATIPRPTVQGYVQLSEAIGSAISHVLQGDGDPAEALEQAAAESTEALQD